MIPKFRAFLIEEKTMRDVVGVDFVRNMYCLQVGRATIGEWFWYRDLELMKSTGLKDKRGFEIFEKDIVKIMVDDGFDYIDSIGLVDWYEKKREYAIFSKGEPWIPLSIEGEIEVIGDIYQNKDLLEG